MALFNSKSTMKKITVFLFTLVLITTVSCKNNKKNNIDTAAADQNRPTLTLENNQREIEVPLSPGRVVVFDIGALDVLDELEVTDRIVAMAKQGIPEYLRNYENDQEIVNAGGLMEPNFEKVHAAKPDLIIIGLRQLKDYDRYAEIAPTYLYELDYQNFVESIRQNVQNLGKIFEIDEKATERLKAMDQILNEEKEKIAHSEAKALLVLFNNGKFSAYGHGSRFGYIFDDFGVLPQIEEIKAGTHGASISSEYILDHDPDILFVVDRNAAIGERKIAKNTIENTLIQKTKAYKNGKIIYLSPETWYIAGGGLQSIEKAIREVGKAY